jgi:DNA-binding response OmpR family regulator
MLGVTASPVQRGVAARGRLRAGAPAQTVLLVEDDEHVRAVLALTLEVAGYEVVAAGDAEQALPLARLLPAIDLVVCDVGLPRCSGVELVRRLREERADVAVLYITGHAEATVAWLGLDDEEPCLRKPFLPAELLDAVAAVAAA